MNGERGLAGAQAGGPAAATVPLTRDVEWIRECFPLGDGSHLHVSVYLVRAPGGNLVVDTGSFLHREAIARRIVEATGGEGLRALILSHTDYPHAGNVPDFRSRWGDLDIVASCGDPLIQGLPYARRSRIGGALDVLGREFRFLDPPLADRSHTTWIYDPGARVLFTADGFGNVHVPGRCDATSLELERAELAGELHAYHRDTLLWLRWVHPPRLIEALERMFAEHPVEWVAPIHGNPVAGVDLPAYLDALTESVERIVGGEPPLQR